MHCLFSVLLSSPWYMPALGCLSNLHWWISRRSPTSCHYKWRHNEHLQTHPRWAFMRASGEICVGFVLICLSCVRLLSRKAVPGNTPSSSAVNPLQIIGKLQLSNFESMASQLLSYFHSFASSYYDFCFHFPPSPALQLSVPSFFLISCTLLLVSSYSRLL